MGETPAIGNVVRSKTLTEMAMGYARSRVLCAAARLGVGDALGDEEKTAEQLAIACGADQDALYRLLRALAAFGVVVERSHGRFALTPLGQPLRKDAPNSEWPAVVFWADLLAYSWSHLTESVRAGKRPEVALSLWSQDPETPAIFRAVMGTAPAEDYMPIARAWDFSKYRAVADLGGGGGSLIAAVLEAYPNVQGMLVDRPESIERARTHFGPAALAARCKLVVADLCESVPPGADVYMMKHVLHGCEDGAAIGILQNCRRVLPREGRVLIIEFVLPDVVDHADPDLERQIMSDINMLAVTGGKERSAIEWRNLLGSAGFATERVVHVHEALVSIIEAAPGN